jgi:hypothetical protein
MERVGTDLRLLAHGESGVGGWGFVLGVALAGALGAARLAIPGWPLHPIGLLVCAAYPMWTAWFSFLLAWLIKVLVLRYGGNGVYQRLKPVAYGLIAGEVLAVAINLLICLLVLLAGGTVPAMPRLLPG